MLILFMKGVFPRFFTQLKILLMSNDLWALTDIILLMLHCICTRATFSCIFQWKKIVCCKHTLMHLNLYYFHPISKNIKYFYDFTFIFMLMGLSYIFTYLFNINIKCLTKRKRKLKKLYRIWKELDEIKVPK